MTKYLMRGPKIDSEDLPSRAVDGSPTRALTVSRWRVLLWLAAIFVLLGGAFAWWQRPLGNGTILKRSALQQLPEGHLFYPGAVVLGTGGRDYEWGIWGSNPAISGYLLGANASPREIEAFYDRELTARGWEISNTAIVVGTNEISGAAWRRDQLAIQLAILRPNDPQNPPEINAYSAPYRIDLVADRPTK